MKNGNGKVFLSLLLLLGLIYSSPPRTAFGNSFEVWGGAPLWTQRDRLLDLYAKRLGLADRCAAWNWMNPVRKAVFLTISHNLWHHYLMREQVRYLTNEENPCELVGTDCTEGQCSALCTNEQTCQDPWSCMNMGGYMCWQQKQCERVPVSREGWYAHKLIDHVDNVYAVLDDVDNQPCGGENDNRIFFSLDDLGIFALRNITMGYLPGIRGSLDPNKHDPFNESRETETGAPRGQLHYFTEDYKAKTLIGRREVGDVFDPWAVEMDIDYNVWHDSNPLCGNFMADYNNLWGEPHGWWPTEFDYTPGGCQGNRVDEAVDAQTGAGSTSPGLMVLIRGTGFTPAGNKIYFVKDALRTSGPLDPISQSEGEIRVRVPALLGQIYVYLNDAQGRRSNTKMINVGPRSNVASVNAASYEATEVAPESIVAAFGGGLATATEGATTIPLPTVLAGTSASVKDSRGEERPAPLFFVSPTQVNYQMPPGTAPGTAAVTVFSGDGGISTGMVDISMVAPGLFTADGSGRGVPAGSALRVKSDGSFTYELLGRYDGQQGRFVPVPIDLGPESDQVFLVLYGTGIRHYGYPILGKIGGVDAEVPYAGWLADFVGLDQVNMRIPRSLMGRGEVNAILQVNGKETNEVTVHIR